MIAAASVWIEKHRSLAVALVSAGMGVAPLTVAQFASWLNIGLRLAHGHADDRHRRLGGADSGVVAGARRRRSSGRRRPHAEPARQPGTCRSARRRCARRSSSRWRWRISPVARPFRADLPHGDLRDGLRHRADGSRQRLRRRRPRRARRPPAVGALADRLGAKPVLVAGLLVQALSIATYLAVSQLGEFYALPSSSALAYGGVMPLYAVLVRDYFGERSWARCSAR